MADIINSNNNLTFQISRITLPEAPDVTNIATSQVNQTLK